MSVKAFATNLYLHESLHLFSGILLFFLFYFMSGNLLISFAVFFTSLFIDADHYSESLIIYRFNLIKIFKNVRYNSWKQSGKMTIIFHSWELVLLILVAGKLFNFSHLSIAVSIAMAIHYLIDTFLYFVHCSMPVYQYFFVYRAFRKFDYLKLCKNEKQ